MTLVSELAQAQLDAYNASDLDAFCHCYHEEVVVLDDREETLRGIEAFRARYVSLFEHWRFGASVPSRLAAGDHCVDHELWWRVDPNSGVRSEGEILVRYSARDGKIAVVQFLK